MYAAGCRANSNLQSFFQVCFLHANYLLSTHPAAARNDYRLPLHLANRAIGRALAVVVASLVAAIAQAQQVLVTEPFKLTAEGFVNATIGAPLKNINPSLGESDHRQIDAGLRLYAEYALASQRVLGLRLQADASGGAGQSRTRLGERSLIYIDPAVGRFEIGRRRGLPDNLIGYAPNTYAFTSAEFGVNSGRTLDPSGTLVTSFLPAALASRIDAVSENGAYSAFFNDDSPKLVYVSPKRLGTQLGLSFSPQLERGVAGGNPYKQLLQTGLAYQQDFGQDFFRLGGSFSYAALDGKAAPVGSRPGRDLASLSLGGGLNLGEVWDFGANFSVNSKDSLPPGRFQRYGARGATASVNYNDGEWVYGAYLQRADGANTLAGRDSLSAFQLGVAYRIDTQLRVYAAYYRYDLRSSTSRSSAGAVLLAGVRWIL